MKNKKNDGLFDYRYIMLSKAFVLTTVSIFYPVNC